MSRITIDPVTRIEGHLRIDAEVDGGVVRKAWSSGQMFRGIERILQGRDPREAWLFTQRFCGVCTTVHAIASVRAVENALQLEVPLNAQYIRNMIVAAHAMHDHIVHFYHLSALDWVDVVSALKADPAKTSALAESLSSWHGNSRMKLAAVKDRLKGFVDNGQDTHVVRNEGSVVVLFLVAVAGALAMISFGFMMAARFASEELASGAINLASWPMMLLSGVWFSLEGAPAWLQAAARALPLTQMLDAARAVLLDGAGFRQVLPQLGWLALMTLLFLAIAAAGFRWRPD